jgi:hypothetical protein
MDLAELTQRVKEGKSLYGDSDQPEHIQASAYRNSVFSQLKFRKYHMQFLFMISITDMLHPYRGIPHVSRMF